MGDHLFSLEFSEIREIDLFLLHLTIPSSSDMRSWARVLSEHNTLSPKFHLLNLVFLGFKLLSVAHEKGTSLVIAC